jgi:DedD protein
MAFFKFRKGGDESPAATAQPESVEALRRRARHRLIGAAVLVLLGVVGFPLLFDTQPRPVAVDIPIEIPDRNKARPLPAPVPAAQVQAKASAPAPVASASVPAKAPAATGPVSEAAPEPRAEAARAASAPAAAAPTPPAAVAKAETKPAAPPKPDPQPAPEAKASAEAKAPAEAKTAAAPPRAEGSRAQALLEGKPVQASGPEAAGAGRFIVQVGAFADAGKARETRLKVEKAGLKTYTHVAETKDGKRIRVRVGPFATRAEADKAAGRIKELDLPAAILTL